MQKARKDAKLHWHGGKSAAQTAICDGKTLKNCYLFKYLGSMFAADGTEDADLRRRIGMAVSRCGQLHFVLGATHINMKLNGTNAGCLYRFSGKTRVEESRQTTCTYSLCNDIHRRRTIWLSHILRMRKERLVRVAAKVQYDMNEGGNLFMDAPTHRDYDDLIKIAGDRKKWKQYVEGKFGSRKPAKKKATKSKTKPKPKPKKPKATGLTDSQRAAWAHAHFIIHHGTPADAARFLTHQRTVDNTPVDALADIRKMAQKAALETAIAEAMEEVAAPIATTPDTTSTLTTTNSSTNPDRNGTTRTQVQPTSLCGTFHTQPTSRHGTSRAQTASLCRYGCTVSTSHRRTVSCPRVLSIVRSAAAQRHNINLSM